jgi:hypothetical protein
VGPRRPSGVVVRPLNFTVRAPGKSDMSFTTLFGLALIVVFVTLAAVLCARRRAFRLYLLLLGSAVVLGVVKLAFSALAVPGTQITPPLVLFYLALLLPLGVLYALTPGLLVRRGASDWPIVKATLITSVVGIPLWWFYCLQLICRSGDC